MKNQLSKRQKRTRRKAIALHESYLKSIKCDVEVDEKKAEIVADMMYLNRRQRQKVCKEKGIPFSDIPKISKTENEQYLANVTKYDIEIIREQAKQQQSDIEKNKSIK